MNVPNDEEKIPLFRSWTAWYAAVIAELVLLGVCFYFITIHFS
jgi:hypothetical protein